MPANGGLHVDINNNFHAGAEVDSKDVRAFASLCGGVLSLGVVAGAFVCAGMEGAFAC